MIARNHHPPRHKGQRRSTDVTYSSRATHLSSNHGEKNQKGITYSANISHLLYSLEVSINVGLIVFMKVNILIKFLQHE